MGYTIQIGQHKSSFYAEGLETCILNDVADERHEQAPAYGEPTDFTNARWPSYTSWSNAMRFIGLHDLMFNDEFGLMRNHPGCVPLTIEHKKLIDEAYANFCKKYPNVKPGYSPKLSEDDPMYRDEDWPEENGAAVRLEWLKYWVDWALENCTLPVFYNS